MTPSFDTLVDGEAIGDGRRRTRFPESWAQGRSRFGGLSTGFGYAACAEGMSAPPRVVTARLLEPIGDGPVIAEAVTTRAGRSVSTRTATLSHGDRTVGFVDVAFGAARDSVLAIEGPPHPGGDVGTGVRVQPIPNVTPAFLQHLDIRWTEGAPPYSGQPGGVIGGFCRHDTEASGVAALLGLLDAWPAPVLSLHDRPFAASTLQWTAHILESTFEPTDWLRFRSEAVTCANGYATTRGFLWRPDGALMAWMEQLVAVFA